MNDIELWSIERLQAALRNPEKADVNPNTTIRRSIVVKVWDVFRFTLYRLGLSAGQNVRESKTKKPATATLAATK